MTISANNDGTIDFNGTTLTGEQVAGLTATLLAAMIEATEKAGRMPEAKSQKPLGNVHSIRPSMVQIRQVNETDAPLLVLTCGLAHLGVAIPSPILVQLAHGILAYSADETKKN